MMHSLFTYVTLSSVILTTGLLDFSANAQTFFSTPIADFTEVDDTQQFVDIDWVTNLLNSIEQAEPNQVDEDSKQSIDFEQATDSLAALEQAVHTQVNQYRTSLGLPPLDLDSRISQQARNHSQNMASGAVRFSHDGFSYRVQALATVVPENGASENVAYNQGYSDPGTQAVQGWLKSTGHRSNIEGNYNLTGIGVAKNEEGEYYFTQIFVSSRIAL